MALPFDQSSPTRAERSAFLKDRFAETIFKAKQRTLFDSLPLPPKKQQQFKQQTEKRREEQRRAARLALDKMEEEARANVVDNFSVLKDFERLINGPPGDQTTP